MIARKLARRIKEALKTSPVVFLNGARQTGKSTLVQELADEIGTPEQPAAYLTFDKPTQMAAAAAAPESFLTNHSTNLIIDEVQMVPELFRALKVVVDELRLQNKAKANGRYLLTGSANILALPKLADPLVGRMSVLTLYPFSMSEAIGGNGNGLERIFAKDFSGLVKQDYSIADAIKLSTFPEISGNSSTERNTWFDGYLTTLLQRDVRSLADLEKIAVLPALLRVLATRAGNLLNDSDIGRTIGLNPVTAKFYRNILKMMFLNFDVEPWYRNVGKRLVKSPKGYLADTLLLCYMLDLDIDSVRQNKPELFGHILENYVATELTKLLSFGDSRARLLHFRTSDGKEADFILERPDGGLFAIEVKGAESVSSGDFKGIRSFAELAGKNFLGGIVLYAGKEAVPFGENLWAVPFSILWQ